MYAGSTLRFNFGSLHFVFMAIFPSFVSRSLLAENKKTKQISNHSGCNFRWMSIDTQHGELKSLISGFWRYWKTTVKAEIVLRGHLY